MTDGGGSYDETNADAAREALRGVHELFEQNPGAGVEDLRAVRGYENIPPRVQQAIEGLSLSERLFVRQVFGTLLENGFAIQGGFGPQAAY